jgi:Copper type II ascorbate-dependent monooxygenase, C-terminal domain
MQMKTKSRAAMVALIAAIAGSQASACKDDAPPAMIAADGGAAGSGTGTGPASAGHTGAAGHAGRSGSAADGDDAGSAPTFIGEGSANAAANTLNASIVVHQVPAGGEEHMCVVVELPNAEPVWVNEVHATLSEGSHHLIVDRQAASMALQTKAASCSPTMAGDATRLMIAQQHDSRVTLPSGVAYQLEAHQHIFLQLHFINLSDKPEDIHGNVELVRADTGKGTPKEAHSLFTGSLSFELPPRKMTDVTSFEVPGMPEKGADTRHVFALTSHTHSLGVRAIIERVPDADAPATKPLHESLSWSEPPLTQFSPTLDWSADAADGLRLTCTYNNDTDHAVHFGTAFHDEMCFMWLYYYDE